MKSSSCVSLQKFNFENQSWTNFIFCGCRDDRTGRQPVLSLHWLAQQLFPTVRPTLFDNIDPIFKTKFDPILLPRVGQTSFSIFCPTMEKDADHCYHYVFKILICLLHISKSIMTILNFDAIIKAYLQGEMLENSLESPHFPDVALSPLLHSTQD